ncbi:hypothetical protein [Bacillus sp. 1P06AnD]|uniref:hypothetical protein n=1 Tax=Bacillus sp. 1P06AnD TaxID=3132208 RepID=UPI0039A25B82
MVYFNIECVLKVAGIVIIVLGVAFGIYNLVGNLEVARQISQSLSSDPDSLMYTEN